MTLYTNDSAATSEEPVQGPTEQAILCMKSLGFLQRWNGGEFLRQPMLQVPSIVVAYNLFMNAVDRFDQLRSIAPMTHCERGVTMSMLTFVMDVWIINAHAILNAIRTPGESIIGIGEMKERIVAQLVDEHVKYKEQPHCLRHIHSAQYVTDNEAAFKNVADAKHMLLENKNHRSVHCVLCNLVPQNGRGGYTFYSCTACQQGFRVSSFALFHDRDTFRTHREDMFDIVVQEQRDPASKKRDRRQT